MRRAHSTLLLLFMAAATVSSCRNRCYLACTDQTAIQNDYVKDRAYCRDYAEEKIDMALRDAAAQDDKSRKSQLVSLFSGCMSTRNWTVPDGKGEGKGTPPPPLATTTVPVAAPVIDKAAEKAALQRTSECSFARQYAKRSEVYAARAEACDYECAEGLRLAPDAPRPAACPPYLAPKYGKGGEKW